jgi:hypothetical protein
MKFTITLIFTILIVCAFYQETRLIKKGREICYVLKTDKNIKHVIIK